MLHHSFSPVAVFFFGVYFAVSFFLVVFNDFFLVWILMELQMIVFISLFLCLTTMSIGGFAVYFLIQSVASLGIIFLFLVGLTDTYLMGVLFMVKLGVFPLVNWYIWAISAFDNITLALSLSLQKLPSLTLVGLLGISFESLFYKLLLLFLVLNILYCSLMSFSCVETKHSFIWLSMASSFWMVLLVNQSYTLFLSYFVVYSGFLCLFFLADSFSLAYKFSLLNFSSLPPFPDFFFKIFIISFLFSSMMHVTFIFVLTITALIFNVIYSLSFSLMIMKSLVVNYLAW